jgi:hypothetical protein
MNERIKQLLNEATSGHEQEHDHSKIMTVSDKEMEVFAELIIEQCCRALNPMLRDMISRGQGQELIKKHFGVEE